MNVLKRKVKCGPGVSKFVVGNVGGTPLPTTLREHFAESVKMINSVLRTTMVF